MYNYKNVDINLLQGDITKLEVDAIVNAANNTLLGGGGVDGAIHRAGGREILEQCKKLGGCPTGEARITVAGDLPARYVIHTVGPKYKIDKNKEVFLKSAYTNSLNLADDYKLDSIAFPSISTGVYGYPIMEAVDIALQALGEKIDSGTNLKKINFILFSEEDFNVYKEAFDKKLL